MKKISSVCRLKNDENFEVVVNIWYDETNKYDEGEMTFNHVMTGEEQESVDMVLWGWSEFEEEENDKWEKLVGEIQNDDMLRQKIFDEIEIIEY